MAKRNITFNGFDLQTSNYYVTEAQQFESSNKKLNIQSFTQANGGALTSTQFDPKQIIISGYIYGDSQSDLESKIDNLKQNLISQEVKEKDLIIDYRGGIRRFVCTCSNLDFNRRNWTIDYIEWQATFVASNPPFGQATASTTINDSAVYSATATTSLSYTGSINHSGTIRPFQTITMDFNSASSVSKINFKLTNSLNDSYDLEITESFSTGDQLIINVENGQVTLNGDTAEWSGGMPQFTLEGNAYTIEVKGVSYNIDIKFSYYPLWL
jgi:predicted phage tail component-like protein